MEVNISNPAPPGFTIKMDLDSSSPSMGEKSSSFSFDCVNDFILEKGSLSTSEGKIYRCFVDKKLCDVKIITASGDVHAHKIVLTSKVPYFERLFLNPNCPKDLIYLTHLPADTVEAVIEYLYSNSLQCKASNVFNILQTSMFLAVDDIILGCVRFIRMHVNTENVFEIVRRCDAYSCSLLFKELCQFIILNFKKLWYKEDFVMLPFAYVEKVIKSDELVLDCEENVFECICRWTEFESNRLDMFPSMLAHVRLCYVDTQYLISAIDNNRFVQSFHSCREMVRKVKSMHMVGDLSLEHMMFKKRNVLELSHIQHSKCFGFTVFGLHVTSGKNIEFFWHNCNSTDWEFLTRRTFLWNLRGITSDEKYIYIVGTNGIGQLALSDLHWRRISFEYEWPTESAVIMHNSELYSIGGVRHRMGNVEFQNSVVCSNINLGTLSAIGNLLICRSRCVASVLNDKIYILGGRNGATDNLTSIEEFSLSSKTSCIIGSIPQPHSNFQCTIVHRCIFLCGGKVIPDNRWTSACQIFDLDEKQWSDGPKMDKRYISNAFTVNNKLHVVHGKLTPVSFCHVKTLNHESGMWSNVEQNVECSCIKNPVLLI